MPGQSELVDTAEVENDRMARLAEARAARQREIYPCPCPTCGALIGEACITRTGGRTAQHAARYSEKLRNQRTS